MKSFFDEAYLRKYTTERTQRFFREVDLVSPVGAALDNPAVLNTIRRKIDDLKRRPGAGAVFATMVEVSPGGVDSLIARFKPVIASFAEEAAKIMSEEVDVGKMINVRAARPSRAASIHVAARNALALLPQSFVAVLRRYLRCGES